MKEDGRKNNGGNKNCGRKPKADEIKLIESMDAIAAPDTVWQALYNKVIDGDTQAIKTWLSYRFGMPKQTVDNNNKHSFDNFSLKDVLNFDNTKQ